LVYRGGSGSEGYPRLPLGAALLKVEWTTTVSRVIVVESLLRWAVASNERAVANARAAATECSRQRVERAEVDQLLAELTRSTPEVIVKAAATGH
jgi:hypothetical protein